MGVVRGGRSFMEDFDEFLAQALTILAEPFLVKDHPSIKKRFKIYRR